MKKTLLLACASLIFLSGTLSVTQDGKYRIEGTIDRSFDDLQVVLSLYDDYHKIINTYISNIDQGRFSFEGDEYLDGLSSIVIKDESGIKIRPECNLLLEQGIISVSYTDGPPHIGGTPLNDIFMEYQDSLNYFISERKKIEPEWWSEIFIRPDSDLGRLYYRQGEYMMNFIERNFLNQLGRALFLDELEGGVVARTIYVGENIERYDEIFSFLDSQTISHPRYVEYEKSIKKMMAGSFLAGKKIENFALLSVDGNTKNLSDYIGKKDYLFLEFWASWCGPCLAAIPELKEIYAEYSDRLEIVSISLDTKETSWVNAMKAQDMPWPQLGDMNGLNSDIAKALDIKAIPFALLLDKQGVVIMQAGASSLKYFMQKNN